MSKKILIIDDETDVVNMLFMRLSMHGFDVVSATDGESGFERAVKYQPDVILMDITMPGWNGIKTATQLKADPSTAEIPVIFLTGLSEDSISRQYLEKGNFHVLLKPFKVEELLSILSNDLGI